MASSKGYSWYEILSVVPVSGYFAEYYEKVEGSEEYVIFRKEIQALGIAKRWSSWIGNRGEPEYGGNYVVGLELEGGDFEISNERENFIGLCREGDVDPCLDNVPLEIRRKLKVTTT